MSKAKKSARRATGRPFKAGRDPRRGVGKKGRSGRKPEAFKRMCRALASCDATLDEVETILKDADHQHFMAALKWATEQGFGKPTQPVEHSADAGFAALVAQAYRGGEP